MIIFGKAYNSNDLVYINNSIHSSMMDLTLRNGYNLFFLSSTIECKKSRSLTQGKNRFLVLGKTFGRKAKLKEIN